MRPRSTLFLLLVVASASTAAAAPLSQPLVGASATTDLHGAGNLHADTSLAATDPGAQLALAPEVRIQIQATLAAGSPAASTSHEDAAPSGSAAAAALAQVDTSGAATAAGATGLALAAVWFLTRTQAAGSLLARGAGVLAAPLFSRIGRSELLENETRERIYDIVRDNPGLSMKEIGERAGTGWGTVVYHLERLEAASFLASRHTAGNRCYFAVGHVPAEEREALGLLQREAPKRIAELVLHQPGVNQTDVCEALGIAASTAHKHLNRLAEANLVRSERAWRSVHYFPSDLLVDHLGAPEPAAALAAAVA